MLFLVFFFNLQDLTRAFGWHPYTAKNVQVIYFLHIPSCFNPIQHDAQEFLRVFSEILQTTSLAPAMANFSWSIIGIMSMLTYSLVIFIL